jgi:very-short-patch-repair endonuclease
MVEFSGNITKCHQRLHDILAGLGFKVVDNADFEPYKIDCYVDELHLGFEADGIGYHWKRRDAKRDAFILENYRVKILRITDKDLLNKKMQEDVKNRILEFVTNG